MQAILAAVLAVVSSAAYVSQNSEITDPKAIQAFLADPQTHAYNMRDPVGWKSFRKVLQLGVKQRDGSCKYPMAVSTAGSYVSFATEIAVNKVRCESLVIEGNPGSDTTKRAQAPAARNLKTAANSSTQAATTPRRP